MSFQLVNGILEVPVANLATFTCVYPPGFTAGHFSSGVRHSLIVAQSSLTFGSQFSLSFGASALTITNRTGDTLPARAPFTLQLEILSGKTDFDTDGFAPANTFEPKLVSCNLGSPALGVSDAIAASQTLATTATLVTSPYAMDVPRNVICAFTGAATVTFTGLDQYGSTMTEAFTVSGTGKKAFKSITSIATTASVTSFTAGTGNVLGLPFFLPFSGALFQEAVSGSGLYSHGTVVAGLSGSASSATSADVRGTFAPDVLPNGTRNYTVYALIQRTGNRGIAQA